MLKNKFSYTIFSIFFIIFSSCSHADLSSDKKYNNYLNYFDKSLTSHFPKKYKSSSDDYTYTVDTTANFNTEELNLTFKNAFEQIEDVKSKYVKSFSIDDSCIVVVNDFLNNTNLILDENKEYHTTFSKNCDKKYYIIPNFWNNFYATNNTRSKLSKDFKYIIIDSKIGLFSNKIIENTSYMPEEFKHGYSKGIAYNEKEGLLIYWLILW